MHIFVKCHDVAASEVLTVTDYRGHRETVVPVRRINVKACALTYLEIKLRPMLSMHCASGPLRQAKRHCWCGL